MKILFPLLIALFSLETHAEDIKFSSMQELYEALPAKVAQDFICARDQSNCVFYGTKQTKKVFEMVCNSTVHQFHHPKKSKNEKIECVLVEVDRG